MGCPALCNIGDNLVFSIATHDPDTGVLTVADALPTYRVYDETPAVMAALSGTMALTDAGNTTGFYTAKLLVTSANGFISGKTYTIYIEATVDGDTGGITFAFKADNLLQRIATTTIGDVSGAGTGTESLEYGGITATSNVDTSGNRVVTWS